MPKGLKVNNNKFTKAQFAKAIPGSGGVLTRVAKKVGCHWQTARHYIDAYPDLKEALEAEREVITDTAEDALISQIKSKEQWAVKFWLTTIGKHRGFTERKEVTGADGAPVHFTLDIGGDRDSD